MSDTNDHRSTPTGNGVARPAQSNAAVRDALRPIIAEFADADTERAYRAHLTGHEADRELLLQTLGIGVYLSYSFLDLMVGGALGAEFVMVRFIFALPIIVLGVLITSFRRYRRYVEYSTTFGFAAMSLSIVYMIYRMPGQGAPPYIIGLLVVMVFASCLMRVSVKLATPVFVAIAATYCVALILGRHFTANEIASGYFFMISVTGVAVVSNYLQERRSRQKWAQDVQRKRDAARIEQLLVEATAADRSKLNFLSILTHELRTPLHQIIGYDDLLRNQVSKGETDDVLESIDQISTSAHGLLKKLSQMLRYADATAGKLDFLVEDIEISEIIDCLGEKHAASVSGKSISLDTSGVQKAVLRIDQHHTSYALSNLIENAIGASRRDTKIVIEGRIVDDFYQLDIADQGCGMAPEKLKAAFSPFEQTDSARSRLKEGLGLGIPIARLLLEGQDARLTIETAEGSGTTASVRFLLAQRAGDAVDLKSAQS
ncbi:MAG: HAMP domain-containing sensor histidine kinase [Parvularculaceae bacterium]|nr:ATP-binding protein [Parvularculaceae bacterium]